MNTNPTPIVSPVLALLKSRKTMVALATALVNILVLLVPSLEPVQGELITVVTILGTVLIASISWEDSAAKGAPTTVNTGSGDVSVTQPTPPDTPPADESDTAQYTPLPPEPPRSPYSRN